MIEKTFTSEQSVTSVNTPYTFWTKPSGCTWKVKGIYFYCGDAGTNPFNLTLRIGDFYFTTRAQIPALSIFKLNYRPFITAIPNDVSASKYFVAIGNVILTGVETITIEKDANDTEDCFVDYGNGSSFLVVEVL